MFYSVCPSSLFLVCGVVRVKRHIPRLGLAANHQAINLLGSAKKNAVPGGAFVAPRISLGGGLIPILVAYALIYNFSRESLLGAMQC